MLSHAGVVTYVITQGAGWWDWCYRTGGNCLSSRTA